VSVLSFWLGAAGPARTELARDKCATGLARYRGGAAVIDLGCGSAFPITEILVTEGLNVYAIDASPSLVEAFRHNLPKTPVACEAVEDTMFFDRMFDGVVAWGLMFLLPSEGQRRLIQTIANILVLSGRLLFTSWT